MRSFRPRDLPPSTLLCILPGLLPSLKGHRPTYSTLSKMKAL